MDKAVPFLGADSDTSLYLAYQPAPAGKGVHYERRRPEDTVLYQVVQEHLDTFLAQVEAETGSALPAFVQAEFEAFLQYGILAHGFLRLRCADCAHEKLVAYSFRLTRVDEPSEEDFKDARRKAPRLDAVSIRRKSEDPMSKSNE